MRLFFAALTLSGILVLPTLAQAQSFELSLGTGLKIQDDLDNERLPTNIMATIGFAGLPIIEPQLGIVGDLGDVENSDFDLQLRPQVKVSVPVIPVYAKVIFSVVNLIGDEETEVYYGGGLGFELPFPLASPFVEAAYLPTSVDGLNVFEARLGVGF
ncbi:MAG: hypothetical protein AAFU77_03325 [Myxococcota bacterium]